MATGDESSLDLKGTVQLFKDAVETSQDGDDILLAKYCAAYRRLSTLLDSLGRIMYFVVRDVNLKLGILEALQGDEKNREICTNFVTLRSMCKYEESQYKDNKPVGNHNTMGCRNLLRLHRALLFILQLFEQLMIAPAEKELSAIAQEAYKDTLYKHHSTIARTAVSVAFHALPYRATFVDKIVKSQSAGSNIDTEDTCQTFLVDEGIPRMKKAYEVTEKIYAQFKMLNLP